MFNQVKNQNAEKALAYENDDFSDFDLLTEDFEMGDGEKTYGETQYVDSKKKGKATAADLLADDNALDGLDGFNPDGLGGGELQQQLSEFKTVIEKSSNLSAEEKKDYLTKIEKWTQALDLHMDPESIQTEFETLQQEVGEAGAFPANVRNLAKSTGVDPAELNSLFKKHGLNAEKLPSPSDSRVAALLNDPDFSEKLGEFEEGVSNASKALGEEIKKQSKAAKEWNSEAKKNNKIERSSDDSSYQFLYDAHFHQDDKSKALIEAHKQLTAEKTKVLAAIYGKKIKVDEAFDWPKVELVPFEVDLQGAGKTNIPEWMKQAHYPMQSYDRWEYKWEDFALNFLLPVGQGIAWMAQADDLGKRSDLPEGGELINIGVQSSGESEITPETKSETNK